VSGAPPDPWRGLNGGAYAPAIGDLIVLGAGGPAGFNLIRCARTAFAHRLRLVAFDAQQHHLPLLPAGVAANVMTGLDVAAVCSMISSSRALVVAQPDPLVALLSAARAELPTYLPGPRTIELAQDKASTAMIWEEAGLSLPGWRVVPTREDAVEVRRAALQAVGFPQWLRARTGAGARLASLARHRGEADLWCRYAGMRFGEEYMLCEHYLPGRDYGVTLVYWHGTLVGAMTRERLEYLYPQHAVSGRTGTPVAARLLASTEIEDHARRAAEALALAAQEPLHGVYCVDLRCDEHGVPRPTECNAGRFFTTSHAGLGVGLNLVALYVGLALEKIEPPSEPWRIPTGADGTLVLRHIDAGTVWRRPSELTRDERAWLESASPP